MKNVLVTGGAGFIGLHLARLLVSKGIRITIADNFARAVNDSELKALQQNPLASVQHVDVLDSASLAALGDGYSHIFHLAAIIGVQHVLKKPYDVLDLNARMLSNVIAFSRSQQNLERLVFASTSEIYAGTLEYHGLEFPTPETTPLTLTNLQHPRTSYMLSKIYGEAMCLHSGLPVTIVRPHNFYGPRMGLSHVVPELLQKAHKAQAGDKLDVYSVRHQRTFCYVVDAVNYMQELAASPATVGQSFNVGVESPETSILQLAEVILQVTGKPMVIVPQPETPGSPSRRCPSMQSTHAVVAYRARYDLAAGIGATYAWYKDHVFAGGLSAL